MENNNKMVGHIDQPVYYVQPFEGEEIDLVDLWITATNYKKTFLVWAFVFVAFSLIVVTIKFEPTYSFKSIIELESVPGKFGLVESPAALITRTELLILSRMKAQTTDEALLEKIDSVKLSNPKGTQLILLESLIPSDQEKEYADFHQNLIDMVVSSEDKRLLPVRQTVQTEISSIELRINDLKSKLSDLDKELQFRAARIKAQFDQPDQFLKDLEIEISLGKDRVRVEVKLLSSQLSEMELQMNMLSPAILLQNDMSDKPIGLSTVAVFALAVFMSLFLAIFVTMGVIFSLKVKQRRAGEG